MCGKYYKKIKGKYFLFGLQFYDRMRRNNQSRSMHNTVYHYKYRKVKACIKEMCFASLQSYPPPPPGRKRPIPKVYFQKFVGQKRNSGTGEDEDNCPDKIIITGKL